MTHSQRAFARTKRQPRARSLRRPPERARSPRAAYCNGRAHGTAASRTHTAKLQSSPSAKGGCPAGGADEHPADRRAEHPQGDRPALELVERGGQG